MVEALTFWWRDQTDHYERDVPWVTRRFDLFTGDVEPDYGSRGAESSPSCGQVYNVPGLGPEPSPHDQQRGYPAARSVV